MIIYTPLIATLRKCDVDLNELSEKVGCGSMLKSRLNNGGYLSLEVIDRICNVLNCSVEDVVSHRKGDQPSRLSIDWIKMDKILKEQRRSYKELESYCHLGNGYFSHAKKRNSDISEKIVDLICKLLECKREEIL